MKRKSKSTKEFVKEIKNEDQYLLEEIKIVQCLYQTLCKYLQNMFTVYYDFFNKTFILIWVSIHVDRFQFEYCKNKKIKHFTDLIYYFKSLFISFLKLYSINLKNVHNISCFSSQNINQKFVIVFMFVCSCLRYFLFVIIVTVINLVAKY